MDFDTKDYNDFLKYFFKRKNNLLRQSNATPIKRLYVFTQDLSQIPYANGNNTVTINGNYLFKIPTNFTGLHFQQAYQTNDPTVTTSAKVYLTFDDNNIGNVSNSKLLQYNDSFELNDGEVANAWLWWDVQENTTISIAFFIDMDYRAGTSATSIVGDVDIANGPNTAVYTKYPIPVGIHSITCSGNGGAASYTVPSAFYARVTGFVNSGTATGFGNVSIDTIALALVESAANLSLCSSTITVLQAQVISCSSNGANSVATAHIELYPI